MNRFGLIIALQVVTLFGLVLAGVSGQVSYQGRLTTPSGDPVTDGVYALKFSIYDASAGGSQLWSTTGSIPLQVTDGLFSHSLGASNPLPDSLSDFDSLWLGITVNLDSEILPRTRLSSSLYSFRALRADKADTATHSLDKTIDAGDLVVGTLSNDRYSAYSDLVAEGQIGTGGDQIAPGIHDHVISGISSIQDSSNVAVSLNFAAGSVLLKSFVIPAGTISDYFKLTTALNVQQTVGSIGNWEFTVWMNNNVVATYLNQSANYGNTIYSLGGIRLDAPDQWMVGQINVLFGNQDGIQSRTVDFTNDVLVEIYGRVPTQYPENWNAIFRVFRCIVEYR